MSITNNTLNYVIVELFNHILFIEEKKLKEQGITLSISEVHVLEAVYKSQKKTMGDIAKALNITLGTLSVAIKKLEKKGYLRRYKDSSDKRIVRVELFDKANDVLTIHESFHNDMIQAVTKELNDTEEEALIKALQKIISFFQSEKS